MTDTSAVGQVVTGLTTSAVEAIVSEAKGDWVGHLTSGVDQGISGGAVKTDVCVVLEEGTLGNVLDIT